MSIAIEPPPEGSPQVKAYANRLLTNISNELDKSSILPKYKLIPDKPVQGKLYYFLYAVDPDITEEGIWIYKQGQWILVA